ncbi:MAG: DUF3501 family protein [Acidimicrobiales bacterium]
MALRALTLDDIMEPRAYERQRDVIRNQVISLKAARRVAVGPVISLVFENRDTIRFQVHEMARAERAFSDEAVEELLGTYNPLIPQPGQLSATLLIELTTKSEMEHWLPRLVGIETAVRFEISPARAPMMSVPCRVEDAHAASLTRAEVTSAVHFILFDFAAEQADSFPEASVALVVDHPFYQERVELSEATKASLASDLSR